MHATDTAGTGSGNHSRTCRSRETPWWTEDGGGNRDGNRGRKPQGLPIRGATYTGTLLGALTEGVIAVHGAVKVAVTQLRTRRTQARSTGDSSSTPARSTSDQGSSLATTTAVGVAVSVAERAAVTRPSGTGKPERVMAVSDTVSVATTGCGSRVAPRMRATFPLRLPQ